MPFRNPIRQFYITDIDGNLIMSIDEESGAVSTPTINVSESLTYRGNELETLLDRMPKGLVARATGTATAAYLAESQTYMQLDFDAIPGRHYFIRARGFVAINNAAGRAFVSLTYTDTGAAADASSTTLIVHRTPLGVSVYPFEMTTAFSVAPEPGGEPVPISLCLTSQAEGSGQARIIGNLDTVPEITVQDVGTFVFNTSIDRTPTAPPPPPTRRNYVTTWYGTAFGVYNGYNDSKVDQPDMVHGPVPGATNNNRFSICVMNGGGTESNYSSENGKTIEAALAGATLTKVEVFVRFDHWYNSSGGTIHCRPWNSTSVPSSAPTVTGTKTTKSGVTNPGGAWFTLNGATSSIRGILLGATGTSSLSTYGRAVPPTAANNKPRFKLYYTR